MFVTIQGRLFFQAIALCEKCARSFSLLIDWQCPPHENLRMCPTCHPDFPPFDAEVEIGQVGGPVLISMMVVDARESKLFRVQ